MAQSFDLTNIEPINDIDLELPVASEPVPEGPLSPSQIAESIMPVSAQALPPEATPTIPENYDESIKSITDTSSHQVQSSFYAVKDTNPDQYAEHRALAEKIGVPVESVAANPEAAKAQAKFLGNDYFDEMTKQNPALAGLMAEDKDAASLMHDDVEELSGVTGWFKAVGKKAGGSYEDATGASDVAMRKLIQGEEITDADRKTWEEEASQPQTDYGYDGFFSDLVFSSAEQFGPLAQSTKGAAAGATVGAGVGAAAGVWTGPGVVATSLAGAGYGGRTGAVYQGSMMEGGFALKEFATMKDETGAYIDPGVARAAASVVALANGGLEAIGFGYLVKNIPGGDKLMQAGTRQGIKQALRRKDFRDAVTAFGKKYAGGIAAETATEAAQELFTILGSVAAASADGDQFDTGTFGENAERVGDAAVQAMKSMILLNAPGPTAGLARDVKAMKRAETDKQRILDLAGKVETAKTTQRAPDKLQNLINRAKQEGDYQHAYIDTNKFDELYQTKGIDPKAIADELGISQEYEAAKATGGPLAVPIEIYASRMIPNQDYKALIDHTKFDPEGVNVTEAQEMQARYQQRVDKEVERVRGDLDQQSAERTIRAQIFDDALETLTSIGTPEAQARQYSELIAARYSALGESTGLDPLNLYRASGISSNVRRSLPQSLVNSTPERLKAIVSGIQGETSFSDPVDAQAAKDLQAFGESLGFDAKSTDPGLIARALQANSEALPTGEQILNQGAQQLSVSLSANTGTIPGIQQIYDKAAAGDIQAHKDLNLIAANSLRRLLSAAETVTMEADFNTGLYGGYVEPSLGLTVNFDPEEGPIVLAALARFAQNFNQEQVHVRQYVDDSPGTVYPDGSYVTRIYRVEVGRELSRPEIERLIEESGLYGLTFNDGYVEAYYVGDAQNAAGFTQFETSAERLVNAVGSDARTIRAASARLWVYGRGDGAIPYEQIAGDLQTEQPGSDPTAQLIGARYLGGDITPAYQEDSITPIQRATQERIADEYDALPVMDMQNPLVMNAYSALAREVVDQFQALPIKVEVWDATKGEPYANSEAMRRDVQDNNHLFIYATTPESFGPKGADFTGHPLLEQTGLKDINGKALLANDALRAVHDYYAHNITPTNFGPRGEEAAWRNHMTTIRDPWARWALTSETRGQNSWVNFGRHVRGQNVAIKDRPFADQKAALLPIEDSLTGNEFVDQPVLELMDTLTTEQRAGSLTGEQRGGLLYQDGGNVQGAYNRITKTITLFEKADLSTLLHELGHLWLDETRDLAQRADVRQEFKQDWVVIQDWLGIQGGETITRAQHEKFARTFELYLREGNAPSISLQSAFDSFASWLRRIYRTVQMLSQAAGFQVQMNSEVRKTFDRMIATSEEIDQMRQQAEFMEDPAIMEMMGASEKADYIKQKAKAKEQAKAKLMTSAMKAVRQRRTAEWREEADNVRRELTEQAKLDPIYQAIEALTRGHFIDDPKNTKGLPRVKIDRAWFLETYGVKPPVEVIPSKTGKTFTVLKNGVKEGTFKSAEKAFAAAEIINQKAKKIMPPDLSPLVRRALAAEDGMHPDQAAAFLAPGTFQSGRAMVEQLMKTKPLKEHLDDQVKAEMDKRYPEMLDEASITEEALKALYNEEQASTLEIEYNAIARRTNYQPFTKEMARSIAERLLSAVKIRDLRGTYHYHRTGLQLAQKLGKALAKKQYEDFQVTDANGQTRTELGAATLKKQQMINHYLYSLTRENEQLVDQKLRYLKKFSKSGVRAKLDHQYMDQIDELLEGYDLRAQSSAKIRDKREALRDFLKRMEEGGTPIDIPERVIADAYRTSYKDMNLADFLGMADTIEGIEHLGRLKNKLLKAADEREFEGVVTGMLQAMEAEHPKDLPDKELAPGLKDKLKGGLSSWHAWHWKPEFMFRFLDGYKELGPVWTALFKPIADAEAEENVMQAEYIQRLRTIFDGYDRGETRLKFFIKPIWVPELQKSLTKDNLMAMALNWGNEYNRQALVEGYKKLGWNEELVKEVLDKYLTAKDWQIVQQTWDLIDTLWPRIEAMEKRLTGKAPEKVVNAVFSTPHGTMRGGYYPVSFDPDQSERAFKRAQKADQTAVFQDNFTKPATRKGHTKERQGTGGQAINLSMSVVSDHLYNVIHDLTHREAGIDVLKLLSDDRVESTIIKKAGREAYRQLLPWLQRVINDKRQMENPVTKVFGKIRANTSIVTMGLKVTTAIQQPLGYLTTIDAIGHKYAGHGLKTFYGTDADANPLENMKFQAEQVNKLSPFMSERSKTFDRDVRESLNRIARDSTVSDWRTSMFIFTQMVQKGVDYPTWLGAYSKGMNELFDGDESKAVDYADSIVRRSQSSGSAKDLAAIQTGGEFARLFTMYYSYFSVLYNVGAERIGQVRTGRIGVAKAAASALYLWVLPALLGSLMTGGPDDDESYPEWAAKTVFAYPFMTIVGVRDLVSASLSDFDYRMSPVAGALNTMQQGVTGGLSSIFTGDDFTEFDQKNLVSLFGYGLGLPTNQVWNMLDYLRDYANGEKEGFSLYEFLVKNKRE